MLNITIDILYQYVILIFDINIKVQLKLVGYLAPNVTSLATAKRVFDLDMNGLAGFACVSPSPSWTILGGLGLWGVLKIIGP